MCSVYISQQYLRRGVYSPYGVIGNPIEASEPRISITGWMGQELVRCNVVVVEVRRATGKMPMTLLFYTKKEGGEFFHSKYGVCRSDGYKTSFFLTNQKRCEAAVGN